MSLRSKELGICKLYIDTGVWAVASVFFEEVYRRLLNFESHKAYLNAMVGCGSGTSIALLTLLTASEVSSCATLVLPSLYRQLGTEIPSVALGISLLLEMGLYRGFSDSEILSKACFLWAALLMIGLLRGMQRARVNAVGTPLHGASLSVESWLRAGCTKMKYGLILPPVVAFLLVMSFSRNFYWSYTGTAFEVKRSALLFTVSKCALLLILAGQDRSNSTSLASRVVHWSRETYRRARKACCGYVAHGRKNKIL